MADDEKQPEAGSAPHVAAQLAGRSWDELGVLESAGHLLFPEKIFKRNRAGKFDEVAVCIRVPREPERRKARVMARQQAISEGIDPEKDADLFEDMENLILLWMAVRSTTPPHEPLTLDHNELQTAYDKRSLMHVWSVVDSYAQLLDPRPDTLSANELTYLIAAIAKERTIRPLRAYGPAAQAHFVLYTVALLMSLQESKLSLELSAHSTPDLSASTPSSPPSEAPT